jgi:hypothetical protein
MSSHRHSAHESSYAHVSALKIGAGKSQALVGTAVEPPWRIIRWPASS